MGISYLDTRVYRYGEFYKVIYLKRYASADMRLREEEETGEKERPDGKLLNNICRAKSTVMGLGYCNDWEYFVTFTLDKTKYNRFDLQKWRKDFGQYIRDERKRTGQCLQYLLIPERHKDKAWHMHGLIMGYSWDLLSDFVPGKHPQDLIGKGYRYHKGILDKFGFNSFAPIRNKEASVRYMMKYITKSMAADNDRLGAHLYYASQGLNRPELVMDGATQTYLSQIDYSNEFFSTGWVSYHQLAYIRENLL